MNPQVDQYFAQGCGRCPLGGTADCKVHNWPELLTKLRTIILNTGLIEELKWGVACYTYNQKNVAILSAFKEYASLSFFKGSLLKDAKGLLVAPGKSSQASRLFKFTKPEQIIATESDITAYLYEAIEVEKAGLKVPFRQNPEPIPEELQQVLDEDAVFRNAFEALTPGRQRGYIIHFSQPKQSKTRTARIEKWTPKILNGEGMHDAYKRNKR